jgi:hypothetical protein
VLYWWNSKEFHLIVEVVVVVVVVDLRKKQEMGMVLALHHAQD